jgi:hypothetical protein
VLLSDSCLPLVPFDSFYEECQDMRVSTFDMKDHTQKVQREQRENIKAIMEQMQCDEQWSEDKQRAWRLARELAENERVIAHSQWCLLTRRDAEALADDKELKMWLEAYKIMLPFSEVNASRTLAADELLIATYLSERARRTNEEFRYTKRQTTFCRCCLDPNNCKCTMKARNMPPRHAPARARRRADGAAWR